MTVGAALLRKLVSVKRWWRRVHVLNYLVFALVWLHSWNIGSDVQGTNLRWLWLVFGVSAIVATFLRLTGARQRAERVVEPSIPQPVTEPPVPIHQTSAASSEAGFVRVAALDQLADGKPFCATVNGKQLALFRLGNEVFALDNRCNHAAGPLCEGFVEGSVVECPLHGSRFNVQTGAVLRGPALDPQPVYQVRVQGQSVEVKT
ncbi:MAG: non-heme iron oxygenase ferredoxin subunit [Candidatus Kerfeldbacteria bacterium]|nr:non-heme iron oxygenase ferredoxin subunit [Candidatus Kerfeldbacteria bacterium]